MATEVDPLAFQKGYAATQNLFDNAQQNRLQQMTMQRAEDAYQQEQAANRLLAAAVGPEGTIDRTKALTGYAQAGLGSKIPALQTQFAQQDKAQREAQKAQIEQHIQMFDVASRVLSGVKDQAGYDQARAELAQFFPDQAAKMPAVYDAATIEANRMKALPLVEQLKQQYQQMQFAETQRHNQATEGLTAQGQQLTTRGQNLAADTTRRGQDITMRVQDLTDARTREANATKAAAEKAPTEFQGKSATYGARAEEADRIIAGLPNASPLAVNAKQAAGRVPLVGGVLETIGNAALSPQNQQLEQAQRDFINATLRQESGAAISPSEFDNAKRQYFPQAGDSEEVIAQKAANRKLAIEGFKRSAGKAAFSAPGGKAKPSLSDIFGN